MYRASSIKIMPKPVEGVDGVYNPFIMQGGSDPESDDSIRGIEPSMY